MSLETIASDDHLKFIIYMKAGPYCGFTLEQIIQIKLHEQAKYGKFFWGYGGVFCHPKRVLPFVESALDEGVVPTVLFSLTKSRFASPIGRATYYSVSAEEWDPLPKSVLLIGNQYALVARGLKQVTMLLDLTQYRSVLGTTVGKSLAEYIRYRVDKSCALRVAQSAGDAKPTEIAYVCELVEPYCVYVR